MGKRYAVLVAMILLNCSAWAMEQSSMEKLSVLSEAQVADLCARLETVVLRDISLVNAAAGSSSTEVVVQDVDVEAGCAESTYRGCLVCQDLESLIAFVDGDVSLGSSFLTDNENFARAVAVVLRCGPLGASSRLRQCVDDDEVHGRLISAIEALTKKLTEQGHQRVLPGVEHYLKHHLGALPEGLVQLFARCDHPLQRHHEDAGGVLLIGAGHREPGLPAVDHHEPTEEEIARAAVLRLQHRRAGSGVGRSLPGGQGAQEGRALACGSCCVREWVDPETGEVTEGCCCLGGKCCRWIDRQCCNEQGNGLSCRGKCWVFWSVTATILLIVIAVNIWRRTTA